MPKTAQKVIGISCLYDGTIVEIPFNEKAEVEIADKIIYKDSEEKEEYGEIVYVNKETKNADQILFTSKILRKATPHDLQKLDNYLRQSENALEVCKKLASKYDLQMQPFRAAYSFDGNKLHFMFTAEERVDFRDLVKDLAKALQKQIHLRQIGPRDKAKVVDGYGRCGRRFCCSTFLDQLESINMEMVRAQSLESKGSSKLSGACGKLLCCLKYEVEQYKLLRRGLPTIGSIVKLKKSSAYPNESARVYGLDILNQKLKVALESGEGVTVAVNDVDKIIEEAKIIEPQESKEN